MPSIFTPKDKERIRRQLLAEGRSRMLAEGIAKTNIDELAKNAGIAKGTFYHFFPSKQDFILEIIHSYQQEKLSQLRAVSEAKKGKLTPDEALVWYRTLYRPDENPLYRLSKKDLDWIMAKIPANRLFRPEADIETCRLILSMIEGDHDTVDCRVLANFPKMMMLALEYRDFMHQEVLETNFRMIQNCMFQYITDQRKTKQPSPLQMP